MQEQTSIFLDVPNVRECINDEDWNIVITLLTQLYPERERDGIARDVNEMREDRWQAAAVFVEDRALAVTLFRVARRLYSGLYIRMDSMVIDAASRSRGLGKALVDWVADYGIERGCERIIWDSYVDNYAAHRFFYREGGEIRGYHFNKRLG